MNPVETQARHYVDARLNAEHQLQVLEEDPRLAQSNTEIDNLRALMAEARAKRDALAEELGIAQRIKEARERLATTQKHLESIWMKALEQDPKHGRSVTLATGDQVQIRITPGVDVVDPRALFKALDERRLWAVAIKAPEKLAAALDAKLLRPLCKEGEDSLPGIQPADKPTLALRRA